jgi:hypothetical protein
MIAFIPLLVLSQSCVKYCDDCLNGVCILCTVGFYESSLGCSPCSSNCLMCRRNNDCVFCSPETILRNGTCVRCSSVLPHCLYCMSESKCHYCREGYGINPVDGRCIECQLVGCRKCPTFNACLECFPERVLAVVANKAVCKVCYDNCLLCSSVADKCAVCSENTYERAFDCGPCPVTCTACVSSTVCYRCVDGRYIDKSGVCEACSKSCQTCFATGARCIQCANETNTYLTITGACNTCESNCQRCTSINLCVVCNDKYYFLNEKC